MESSACKCDINLARVAISTLVAIVTACPSNVDKLVSMQAKCNALFIVGLQTCGDFGIQVSTRLKQSRI